MSRYIDADKLKKVFNDGYEAFAETLCEIVDAQPTADVVERKHGEWIPIKDDEHWYVLRWECSCCGFWTTSDKNANYCEDCGAEMKRRTDE